jgi:hypothetical protein
VLIDTTTVTITRPTASGDPYEAATVTTVAAGVRAHIGSPSGTDQHVGGDKEVISAVCYVPAGTDVVRSDLIADDQTGTAYSVVWSTRRRGLGLDHVQVGLRTVQGVSNG